MSIRLVIPGAPRTKKTSNRVVRCGGFTKVLPSKAHEDWFRSAMVAVWFKQPPITGPVRVSATFFRDADRGDMTGYMQALADFLQTRKLNAKGKMIRDGAGVIADDSQIVSWDGTRMDKDKANPRIEVEIAEVGTPGSLE